MFFLLSYTIFLSFFFGGIIELYVSRKKELAIGKCIFKGYLGMFALFHLLCIPAVLLKKSFNTLCELYIFVLGIGIIIGLLMFIITVKQESIRIKKPEKITIYMIGILLLILLQILQQVFMSPPGYADDKVYLVLINDIIESNALYKLNWQTGLEIGLENVSLKYLFTSYHPFLAFLSDCTNIHPLILCKSILPIIYLPLAYYSVYLLSEVLFSRKEEKELFVLVYAFIILFGGYSLYSDSGRFMRWVWHSKAFLVIVILPAAFVAAKKSMEEKSLSRCIEANGLGIAACGTTLMGIGLIPTVYIGQALVYLIKKKSITHFIFALKCCISEIFFLMLLVLYKLY